MNAAELIELRKRFHWSQVEAARKLGCSTRSIVNWEHGVGHIPDTIALAVAAVVMNIPPYGKKQS